MFIVAGLGNPGREYADTRHNMGFMALDILSDRLNIDVRRSHHHGMFGEGFFSGKKVLLVKPQTYMNNSGICVAEFMNFYKCAHDELIVVYDDIDLSVGDIRIREKGSSGSHNGMKSIIYHLGYDDFPRVRIGIGKPEEGRELVSHVLSVPSLDQRDTLLQAIDKAASAVEMIMRQGVPAAQMEYNKKPKRQRTSPEDAT